MCKSFWLGALTAYALLVLPVALCWWCWPKKDDDRLPEGWKPAPGTQARLN